MVNQTYAYVVKFKEDPRTLLASKDSGGTKRPQEPSSEKGELHRDAPKCKVSRESEKKPCPNDDPVKTPPTKNAPHATEKVVIVFVRCVCVFKSCHAFLSCLFFRPR